LFVPQHNGLIAPLAPSDLGIDAAPAGQVDQAAFMFLILYGPVLSGYSVILALFGGEHKLRKNGFFDELLALLF
jgi:hypothetical protein